VTVKKAVFKKQLYERVFKEQSYESVFKRGSASEVSIGDRHVNCEYV
jgi:hypothetical protein